MLDTTDSAPNAPAAVPPVASANSLAKPATLSAKEQTYSELLHSLYATQSFADVQAQALLLPAFDPDVFSLRRGSLAFCSFSAGLLNPEPTGVLAAVPDTPEARRSLQLTLTFAARYCPSTQDREWMVGQGSAYFEELTELVQKTDSADFRLVDQIASVDEGALSDAEKGAHMAELERILSNTESPAAAEAAGNLLASGRLGQWSAGANLVAGTPMESRLLEIQSAAVIVRRCELSRACGPMSLQVVRMCAPAQCDPPSSVDEYFRRRFSPDEFAVIQAIAARFRP